MKTIEELENEYMEFIDTESGKKWIEEWHGECDFGNYLYDFYPEYLQ